MAHQIPTTLKIREKEELVSYDSPPNGTTVLIVHGVRDGSGENVTGLQGAVVAVLEQAPVEVIGAGFHDHIDSGSACPAKFGIVGRRPDIYGFNGIRGQDDGCKVMFCSMSLSSPSIMKLFSRSRPLTGTCKDSWELKKGEFER